MSWARITHTCGHVEDHKVIGSSNDKDSKIDWLKGTVCTECYKAQQAAQHAAINAEVDSKLPALSGSEKQVKWAADVRRDWIKRTINRATKEADRKLMQNVTTVAVAELTEAKWWIDNRNDINAAIKTQWAAAVAQVTGGVN